MFSKETPDVSPALRLSLVLWIGLWDHQDVPGIEMAMSE